MNKNQHLVIDYIENNRTNSYPIPNERLEKADEYLKNSYLKGLSILLVQSTGVSDANRSFFNRILLGAKLKQNQQDFLRQAYEIEAEDFDKIIEVLKENPLKYRFVVDALLMCNVDQYSEEKMKLVAGLMECFALTQKEAEYLVKISRAILLQNSDEYINCDKIRPNSIDWKYFLDYAFNFVNGIFVNTEDTIAISYVNKSEIKNINNILKDKKKIFLNNIILNIDNTDYFYNDQEFIIRELYMLNTDVFSETSFSFTRFLLPKGSITVMKECRCKGRTEIYFEEDVDSPSGCDEVFCKSGKVIIENCDFAKEGFIKYKEDKHGCILLWGEDL